MNLYPYQLSGGQKQRVSLARAFSRNANVVMLDEPINSLDLFSRKDILGTIENKQVKHLKRNKQSNSK